MKRLRLIIAGNDKHYVKNLVQYIFEGYPEHFELHSFTRQAFLTEFLGNYGEEADVLLLEREFLCGLQPVKRSAVCILLSEENISRDIDGTICIYKYQHAEKIISSLIAVYSGSNDREFLNQGLKKTRFIAVFSGEGGSGKSSIAAACSMICSKQDMKALYLNLEGINSTNSFFSGDSGQTLSNVIYYLKENSSNLISKIEGARCRDPETGVFHFKTPENQRDIEELLFEDVELFFSSMKKAAIYEYIFVDLTTGFMPRNLAVLKNCDILMRIKTSRQSGILKNELEAREYERLSNKFGIDMEGKSLIITNMDRQMKVKDCADSIGYYPGMENRNGPGKAYCSEFLMDVAKIVTGKILTQRQEFELDKRISIMGGQ